VPAFEQEWATALEESRRTFSLTTLYEVVHTWQARLASAPAVDAFLGSGKNETGFVDPEELRSIGRLSIIYWINRPLRHLSVLDIVWLG
jgi:hypothetical protein